mgnify:CR=1 FL=1
MFSKSANAYFVKKKKRFGKDRKKVFLSLPLDNHTQDELNKISKINYNNHQLDELSTPSKLMAVLSKITGGLLLGLLGLKTPQVKVGISETERIVEMGVPVYGYFGTSSIK